MAASKLPSPVFLQRPMECAVCLSLYDLDSHRPMSLYCLHTFCKRCVDTLLEKTPVKCPTCKRQCESDALRTNYALCDVIEMLCQACCGREIAERCTHCNKKLCSECHESHLQIFVEDLEETMDQLREEVGRAAQKMIDGAQIEHQRKLATATVAQIRDSVKVHQERVRKMEDELRSKVMELKKLNSQTYKRWQTSISTEIEKCHNFLEASKDKLLSRTSLAEVKTEALELLSVLKTKHNTTPHAIVYRYELCKSKPDVGTLLSETTCGTTKFKPSGGFTFMAPFSKYYDGKLSVSKSTTGDFPKPVNPGFNFGAVPNFGADKPAVFGDLNKAAGFGAPQTSVFGGATNDAKSKSDASGGLLARLLSEPAKDEPLNLSSDAADSTSNDIIILREEPVPDDKIQQARKWKLPDAYYLYDSRPPCEGCLGPNSAQIVLSHDSTSSIFGKAGSGFEDFGSIATSTKGFAFGNTSGAGASVFGGESPDKKSKDPSKSAEDDDADDDEVSESPDVHFEPIVQLPDNVDLTTGEEGHDKVFSHRAKLYRYDNGEWKERAVGDMKILRDTQTGRYRLIMRREQVLKVACNHYLTADMCLQPLHTSETAWCWYAVDHAENTAEEEQFAVRFKTKDLATAFKKKFDKCKQAVMSSSSKDSTSSIFGKAGSGFGDFGSLASSTKGFAFGNTSGAGASVFGGKSPHEVSESPDVHFEPIIQLPEHVDLTTGEEGHDKVFSHRAKLYRYDNGQWKERAVGDMKILRDAQTGRYRLIMRREQVLKVACNHYLTADMCLQPLHTSETAWCWYAVDHAENTAKEEQFAVRFKTIDLATAFKAKFDECKEAVISSSSIGPSGMRKKLEDVAQTGEEAGAENPVTSTTDADPEDDEKSVGSDDVRVFFSSRATLSTREADGSYQRRGKGELTVTYDEDVFGARIQMVDDNQEFLCNHIICRRHTLNVGQNGKSCEWTAKDFSIDEPIRHTFQAGFSSKNAVDEFKEAFDQGLEWATESEIDEIVDGASVTGEMTEPQTAGSRK